MEYTTYNTFDNATMANFAQFLSLTQPTMYSLLH